MDGNGFLADDLVPVPQEVTGDEGGLPERHQDPRQPPVGLVAPGAEQRRAHGGGADDVVDQVLRLAAELEGGMQQDRQPPRSRDRRSRANGAEPGSEIWHGILTIVVRDRVVRAGKGSHRPRGRPMTQRSGSAARPQGHWQGPRNATSRRESGGCASTRAGLAARHRPRRREVSGRSSWPRRSRRRSGSSSHSRRRRPRSGC